MALGALRSALARLKQGSPRSPIAGSGGLSSAGQGACALSAVAAAASRRSTSARKPDIGSRVCRGGRPGPSRKAWCARGGPFKLVGVGPGVQERVFEAAGERLAGALWAPEGSPRAGLLLVHGFNSSQGGFGDLPRALAAGGFHVLAVDQRGYGRSQGDACRTSVERALEGPDAA